jgi:hypothetical protein
MQIAKMHLGNTSTPLKLGSEWLVTRSQSLALSYFVEISVLRKLAVKLVKLQLYLMILEPIFLGILNNKLI